MRLFYLTFTYAADVRTTWGEPNAISGKCSIAGHLVIHKRGHNPSYAGSKQEWVNEYVEKTPKTIRVTLRQARKLCAGMSTAEFNEHIDNLFGGMTAWSIDGGI